MRSRAILALLVGIATALAGCASPPQRRSLAHALLFDDHGHLAKSAFNAALESRFPPASRVEPFTEFVAAAGGRCEADSQQVIYACTIPVDSDVCGWKIWIRVDSEGGNLRQLDANEHFDYCR